MEDLLNSVETLTDVGSCVDNGSAGPLLLVRAEIQILAVDTNAVAGKEVSKPNLSEVKIVKALDAEGMKDVDISSEV